MRTFEVMFSDLTPEAQARLLKFERIESESDGNLEHFPIAILEREDEYDDS